MGSVDRSCCPDCDRRFGSLGGLNTHRSYTHPSEWAEHCRQVMLAAGVEPRGAFLGVTKPWPSRCIECERDVAPRYADVANGQGACRYCAGKDVHSEDRMSLLAERDLEPLTEFPGNLEKWPCRCLQCKRIVAPRWNNLRRWGGCEWCAGIKIDSDDAAEEMRKAGVEPQTPFPGAQKRWESVCMTCARTVHPKLSGLRYGYGPCPFCSGARVDPDEAYEAMIAAGAAPLEPYPGRNNRPWHARCLTCDREIKPSWNAIQRGQGPCGYCAGKRVDPEEARVLMRRAGADPQEDYTSVETPWHCLCLRCNRTIYPKYHSVSDGHDPCRWCAPAGFDPGKPSRLYVLWHEIYQAWKYGITNRGTTNDRLADFEVQGWQIVRLIDYDTGEAARAAEDRVKQWRQREGFARAVDRSDMPTGGWTETLRSVDIDDPDVLIAIAKMHA